MAGAQQDGPDPDGPQEDGAVGESSTVDLGGPVHMVDHGGRSDGPTVVLVHGLGGSHLNWDLFAPLLTPHARVLSLDLPGFGRSEPGRRQATVHGNVLVLDRFLRDVAGGPAVLVGNSMGGMISILETAAAPELVRGLVLLDPALPGPRRALDPLVALTFAAYALPGVGEQTLRARRRRTGARAQVLDMLRLCGVDPAGVPASLVDRSVALVEQRQDVAGMDRAFLTAARSLLRVQADPRRYRRAMAAISVPVLLVHGERDRLVPVANARDVAHRHPDWRYVELPGVGHVPQLQVPERLADDVVPWLQQLPPG
ncbi:alpha/beta fold hydrolase [Modestobacter sp. VKM Ac-2978]|uniref:alpha/beta fold hydrolase n=1 Tax=Modestobacter sp. VKM Ac-2978 TaxID=3004132 RepID=UPI0022AACA99|nr:alpha/beta hydrolase [Modestobacter sp. VKM Ac-2978]MCZ2848558.1 alpha/beta hydrolase [Modestobacter sp. VKM Ac-2978]